MASPFTLFAEPVESPFTIWLSNNESEVLSTISQDRELMDQMSMPVPILPERFSRPSEALFNVVLVQGKYYSILQKIGINLEEYNLFGATSANQSQRNNAKREILEKIVESLDSISDSEVQVLKQYVEAFSKLYPNEKSGQILNAILAKCFRRKSAKEQDKPSITTEPPAPSARFQQPADTDTSVLPSQPETPVDPSPTTVSGEIPTGSPASDARTVGEQPAPPPPEPAPGQVTEGLAPVGPL